MTYSSPEFLDAHARYERERLARDWQTHHGENSAAGSLTHRARAAVASIGGLRLAARRHRHA